ncbi:MAG: Glucokinase [uncultured Solirubrobacteraceae bacterium]|uniref:Glucokinase n=1 Tax=uncultured Solirubrobacteraceae bacterium TaxID=1162706 RepID=A0A6J4RXT2_9ACTN|nr:MAG: Glucokinase [uncultured Solirubrobacteraceae bacterium]
MSDSYIGVDVGGTKVAVASLADRRFSATAVEPTRLESPEALIEQLVRVITEQRGPSSRAVGIGVPSVVEFATGRIRNSVNIPLVDVPLRALLTERVGLPVYVDNDANCAALAEAHEEGRLTGTQLVMLTIGTGVGGGVVLNGRVFRGATGAAPELGHITIGLDLTAGAPEQSGWPRAGSLEVLASGSALDALAEEAARTHPDSALGRMASDGAEVGGREVVTAAQDGDAVALKLLDVLGQRLGIGIANMINTFDPFEVVIGGGASAAGELLLGPARASAGRYTLPGVGTRTEIRLARHGADAGVHGAALMAAHEEEQP